MKNYSLSFGSTTYQVFPPNSAEGRPRALLIRVFLKPVWGDTQELPEPRAPGKLHLLSYRSTSLHFILLFFLPPARSKAGWCRRVATAVESIRATTQRDACMAPFHTSEWKDQVDHISIDSSTHRNLVVDVTGAGFVYSSTHPSQQIYPSRSSRLKGVPPPRQN